MSTTEKPKLRYEDAAERRTVTGWACKKCGRFWGDDEHMARYCCHQDGPCRTCDARVDKHSVYCQACVEARRAREMAARVAKAEVVELPYPDYLYADGIGHRSGFFEDISDLEEWLADSDIPPAQWPEFAFCCTPTRFVDVDLGSITDGMHDNAYEDWSPDDLDGIAEFEAAIAKFNEANKDQVSWNPDFRRVVRISKPHEDAAPSPARPAGPGEGVGDA